MPEFVKTVTCPYCDYSHSKELLSEIDEDPVDDMHHCENCGMAMVLRTQLKAIVKTLRVEGEGPRARKLVKARR